MFDKDEIKGKAEQAKGVVKEKVGQLTNDDALEGEGVGDQISGKVQEGFGAAKRNVKEAVGRLNSDDANRKP